MDLRQLGAIGERLAVAGNAGQVGLDHHRISEDRSNKASILTDRDNLPGLVSSELREREPIRHFHGVLVLGSQGECYQNKEKQTGEDGYQVTFASHFQSPLPKLKLWQPTA